jgi:4'-phosphopantetheinyl transferase
MQAFYRHYNMHDVAAFTPGLLDDGDVHIWFIPLTEDFPALCDHECISESERRRGKRLVRPEHEERFIRGRRALRGLLAAYLGQRPEAVTFQEGIFGKPSLIPPGGIEFNLSHTATWLMVGIGRGALGVDCEWTGGASNTAELATTICHPDEDSVEGTAFFRLWCRKEAALKAWGTGFSISPCSIDVQHARIVNHPDHFDVMLVDVDAPAEHVAALASHLPPRRLLVTFYVK